MEKIKTSINTIYSGDTRDYDYMIEEADETENNAVEKMLTKNSFEYCGLDLSKKGISNGSPLQTGLKERFIVTEYISCEK